MRPVNLQHMFNEAYHLKNAEALFLGFKRNCQFF